MASRRFARASGALWRGCSAKAHERGISVWLRADLDLLLNRVSRRDDRPLLKDGDKRETLARLIEERYPIYAEADIVVDSEDVPHERMVEKIVDALATYQAANGGCAREPAAG